MGLLDYFYKQETPPPTVDMHEIATKVLQDEMLPAITASTNHTLEALFQAAIDARLNDEASAFRAKLDQTVREHVERITAPITHSDIHKTVEMIAKGMIDQHSTQQWRIREIIAEETLKMQREIDTLSRRIAALEGAARGNQ